MIKNNTVLINLGDEGKIKLDGSSIWMDGSVKSNQITVNVDRIEWEHGYDWDTENEYPNSVNVWVDHDATKDIYTDKSFAKAISKLIGVEVYWSEHGMQDHGKAHLEGQMNDTCIGPMTGRSREERAVA